MVQTLSARKKLIPSKNKEQLENIKPPQLKIATEEDSLESPTKLNFGGDILVNQTKWDILNNFE